MQVNRQKEIELINKAVQISKEANANPTSVLKTLRYLTRKEWQDKVLVQYLDENNTKTVAELADEVNQSRQTVHNFLKRTIIENERKRLKSIKGKTRKDDVIYRSYQILRNENRISIKVISDTILLDSSNNKYFRIKIHDRQTAIYFCKDNNLFIKKHRENSSSKNFAGFIVGTAKLQYRRILLDSRNMEEYFNSIDNLYCINERK